jgi:hypothetical protein
MTPSFTKWLFEQCYRSDLVGELASQVKTTGDWPNTNNEMCFRVYLHQCGASTLSVQAFEIAYYEWSCSWHLPPVNTIFHLKSTVSN